MTPNGTLVIFLTINTFIATGGMMPPIITVAIITMPNQQGSKPSLVMAGKNTGSDNG